MKYGLVILVLCYLFVSGCIPDKKKEEQVEHKKTEIQTTMEHTATPPVVTKEEHNVQIEQAADVEQTSEAEPSNVPVQEQVVVEKQPGRHEVAATKEGVQQEQQQVANKEAVHQKKHPADQPCDLQKRYPSAAQQPAPRLNAKGREIAEAIQKLVVATNNMVYMTRQMVTATEEMLKATGGVAVEVVETGKEIVKTETTRQTAAAQTGVKKAMNNMVEATKKVVEATQDALSTATEQETQQQ